jgi:dipeptidyl aminopeptidase/acylaminoacyl peptidase
LFAVLIDNGVEAEMLRFPESSHELSRSGKPKYRRERFDAIIDWHRRYLDVTT